MNQKRNTGAPTWRNATKGDADDLFCRGIR